MVSKFWGLKSFLENDLGHVVRGMMSGDRLALFARLDMLEEKGEISPEESEKWRKAPSMTPPYHVRWMIRRDLPEMLSLEKIAVEHPWSEDEITRRLRQNNCIGMVAIKVTPEEEFLVGYTLHELFADHINLVRFVVSPLAQGVGDDLMRNIKNKTDKNRRNTIKIDHPDYLHKHFNQYGFKDKSPTQSTYSV